MSRASTKATSVLNKEISDKDKKAAREAYSAAEALGGGPEKDYKRAREGRNIRKKPPVSPDPKPTGPHGEK